MEIAGAFSKLFDPYERQARLYPGLLAVAPAAVVFVCFAAAGNVLGRTILSVLVACGVAYALGRIARNAGKRLQEELFAKWGGAPTTQIMRHRDATIDVHTKFRYHETLAKSIGKPMPTPNAETADPQAADEYYRAATTWLIGRTRDTKAFPLIYKENIAFGFQRNALGLRRGGIVVAALCFGGTLLRMMLLTSSLSSMTDALDKVGAPEVVALLVSLMFLGFWIFLVNETALKRTAFAYAVRLFEGCDHIAQQKTRTSRKAGGSAPA
ncbi:hypothetical protein DBO86_11680 [Pseudomonas indoloxydans]|uniref:Uncharacterized protein n=1 Tax=Ectopseudomonas oleovorans TaxID=301 RepID=A0A2T5PMF4_ECTOL|nr:hypothetical protein [Pseudomonas indoloxydans]PTU78909.1 hypothetical protein DBO86_11680 [Pseudomonas indoloxydans]